jgi:hypothetical protein
MWGMEKGEIHTSIWGERKLGVEVVTVVTTLISLGFSCHHLLGEVVTKPQVVTDRRFGPAGLDRPLMIATKGSASRGRRSEPF